MTIFELYLVNNDWNVSTELRILNRDNSLYKNTCMGKMPESDSRLEVFGFSKNEIIVTRKPSS
jgi:hypothetical protein